MVCCRNVSTAQATSIYMASQIQNTLLARVSDWNLESVLTEVREEGYFSEHCRNKKKSLNGFTLQP